MNKHRLKLILQFLFFFAPLVAFFFAGRKIWGLIFSGLYLALMVFWEIYSAEIFNLILSSFFGFIYVFIASAMITGLFIGFFWINQAKIQLRLNKPFNLPLALSITFFIFCAQNWIILSKLAHIPHHYYLLKVNNTSMQPTILKGDIAIAQKIDDRHLLQRQDVVVLNLPYIKTRALGRIVALPGERIAIKDKKVRVNGHEIMKIPTNLVSNKMSELEEQVLSNTCFFVVAENIADSAFDSLNLGCIDRSQITAKLNYIIFSLTPGQWGRQLSPTRSTKLIF